MAAPITRYARSGDVHLAYQVWFDMCGVGLSGRVLDAPAAGEVLVTRTVRDLVAGSEIRFDDRGEFVLKGVRERWELYATSN